MAAGGWIGFDLDGTLAHYDSWGNGEIGAPVLKMLHIAQKFLASGVEIRIVTARVAPPNDEGQAALIQAWCAQHLGRAIPVTCVKDFGMIALFDDRAIAVEKNTGVILGGNMELFG